MCVFVPVNMARHAVTMTNWLEDLHPWVIGRFVDTSILPVEVDRQVSGQDILSLLRLWTRGRRYVDRVDSGWVRATIHAEECRAPIINVPCNDRQAQEQHRA